MEIRQNGYGGYVIGNYHVFFLGIREGFEVRESLDDEPCFTSINFDEVMDYVGVYF